MADEAEKMTDSGIPAKTLTPEARRALAEAEARRQAYQTKEAALPKELGGGQTSDVTNGLRWAAVAIALPPKPSVRVTIHVEPEDKAKLHGVVVL